ncbi:class I SAM-dependent methyltransferase [Halopseudomonas pachastrellae]|nr:class I SAM-dependent methyltransferase [Halopseudomonas pachastrellae]
MTAQHQALPCPLCSSPAHWMLSDRKRSYWQCERVSDGARARAMAMTAKQEKAEYDRPRKPPRMIRATGAFSRAWRAAAAAPAAGQLLRLWLCPGPALALMLREQGHQVSLHDLYYHPNPAALEQQWDFITATEVVEHLAAPRAVLEQLWRCLKPGGWLGLMTKRVTNPEAFSTWHYKSDPTHISFFSEHSFHWLAQTLAGRVGDSGSGCRVTAQALTQRLR